MTRKELTRILVGVWKQTVSVESAIDLIEADAPQQDGQMTVATPPASSAEDVRSSAWLEGLAERIERTADHQRCEVDAPYGAVIATALLGVANAFRAEATSLSNGALCGRGRSLMSPEECPQQRDCYPPITVAAQAGDGSRAGALPAEVSEAEKVHGLHGEALAALIALSSALKLGPNYYAANRCIHVLWNMELPPKPAGNGALSNGGQAS